MGASDEVSPVAFVEKHFMPLLDEYKPDNDKGSSTLAQVVLSHPHQDHIAECERLANKNGGVSKLYPNLLTCPNDKDGQAADFRVDFTRIKNLPGSESLIAAYKSLYAGRSLPLQTIRFASSRSVPNLEYSIFFLRPGTCNRLHPTSDQDYGNATSIMVYFRHGQHSILFPADMTPTGMAAILPDSAGTEKRCTVFDRQSASRYPSWYQATSNQPSLGALLKQRGLTILVAPHHGLESCYSPELHQSIAGGKPDIVFLSERRKKHDGDGKTDGRYQSQAGAAGLDVNVEGKMENRISVSTVNGHHILAILQGTQRPLIFADRDPSRLLRAALV